MRGAIAFFRDYYKKIKAHIFIYLISSILHKTTIIFIPLFTQKLIDESVRGENLKRILNEALYFSGVTLLFILFLCLKYYYQNLIEIKVINWLKQDLINKINRISYGNLLSKDLGYFTQRINKDIDKIRNLIVADLTTFSINLLYVSTIILIMIELNLELAIILLVIIPLFIFFNKIFVLR